MKTIHTAVEGIRSERLIKELYKKFLNKDNYFHFLYEPELIIRVSDNFLRRYPIEKFLKQKHIDFIIYPFPLANTDKPEKQVKDGFMIEFSSFLRKRLWEITTILHILSLIALNESRKKHIFFCERLFHCGYNMTRMEWEEEGKELITSGIKRVVMDYLNRKGN